MINIQIQDTSKNWITVQTGVMNQSQVIMNKMREAQRCYPNKRVRAVDTSGRLVDVL